MIRFFEVCINGEHEPWDNKRHEGLAQAMASAAEAVVLRGAEKVVVRTDGLDTYEEIVMNTARMAWAVQRTVTAKETRDRFGDLKPE